MRNRFLGGLYRDLTELQTYVRQKHLPSKVPQSGHTYSEEHNKTRINDLKLIQCDLLIFFFFYAYSHSGNAPPM